MAVYIDSIYPYGDRGEPGWSISGEELPSYCMKRGSYKGWHGATQIGMNVGLNDVMPTCYVTRKVYNYLVNHDELEGVRSKILGVVKNSYAQRVSCSVPRGSTVEYGHRRELKSGSIIPGLPEPRITCTPSGSFTSIPSQISASTKTGFPVLTTTLPVTLTITQDCVTTFDKVTTASAPITSLPVIFSINDIDIATAYPTTYVPAPFRTEYPITIDLATYLTTWKHLLSTTTTSLKLKARVEKQILPWAGVGDVGFKALSAETPIPVSVCECDEGETRNPQYCWDWSTINKEICSGGLWTPTGATCPEMPAHGTKGGEITCWDGTKIYTQIFDANVKKWISTGAVCPVMPGAGAVRGETPCWDGSKVYNEKFDAITKRWVLTGAVCPVMPGAGAVRGETPCWDGSKVYNEKFDAITKRWVPTGAVCPVMPGAGAVRGETPCWDGSKIYAEKFDRITGTWIPTGAVCPVMPGAGAVRGETPCWDGSKIYAEKFDAITKRWVPTGATCPIQPPAPGVTCDGNSPTYGTGCALLNHFDADNDGIISPTELRAIVYESLTQEENDFVTTAYNLGSINALCSGCYTPSVPEVTCDGNSPTYGTGCALLNHFDANNDGIISDDELHTAIGAKNNGDITHEELVFVLAAYNAGSIKDLCPACFVPPPAGALRTPTTCWDGSVIYNEKFDATLKRWVPTGAVCPVKVCTEGDKRGATPCWDGSTIYTEICRDNAWVPTGETCRAMLPARVIRMAVPKIVYEGQPVDVVVQAFCGEALSSDEPATLTVDGVDVQTKNTSAGEVKFRWTATGTGMRSVCVNIPANLKCPVAGNVCKTLTVSAYIAGIGEQIKAEKTAYEAELARLKELKRIKRRPLSERAPGVVNVPASLAGAIVEIGGVPTTIPVGGLPIVVSPGEAIVTIIRGGVRTDVPVIVPPGGTIILPEPGGL